ncbi:MAG: patatin-like phospholipase family protein [Ignavibacteria bacterium]|nr:patatin-like phospholipase family protein [Ignavibacteria bacterium]
MKKILTIDGGGIRGVLPARILHEIEKRTKKPIAELFDLIAGTSTGGILALCLTKPDSKGNPRYKALDILKLYEEEGKKIFKKSPWKSTMSVGV